MFVHTLAGKMVVAVLAATSALSVVETSASIPMTIKPIVFVDDCAIQAHADGTSLPTSDRMDLEYGIDITCPLPKIISVTLNVTLFASHQISGGYSPIASATGSASWVSGASVARALHLPCGIGSTLYVYADGTVEATFTDLQNGGTHIISNVAPVVCDATP